LTLRLRAQIDLKDEPFILAEMHYAGIVNQQLSAEQVVAYQTNLYTAARQALLKALLLVGQTPPIPLDVSQLNQV